MSETSKTRATGSTREDETSDLSRFSRNSRANSEVSFTGIKNAAWGMGRYELNTIQHLTKLG